MSEENLEYDKDTIVESERKLSDYFPENTRNKYTYDMGDGWEHLIKLVKVREDHNAESPFLLSAEGQSPPEDVGGINGYTEFSKIMLDPSHPRHAEMKEWAGYWQPELTEWFAKPKV